MWEVAHPLPLSTDSEWMLGNTESDLETNFRGSLGCDSGGCRSFEVFAVLDCQFRWLRGTRKLLIEKTFWLRGACNHPNLLVLPFSLELILTAA